MKLADKRKIKNRKHSNNKGYRMIQNGTTRNELKEIAKKLKIPFEPKINN